MDTNPTQTTATVANFYRLMFEELASALLACNDLAAARALVALHPLTPPELLVEMVDPNLTFVGSDVLAAITSPRMPLEHLEEILLHGVDLRLVQAVAQDARITPAMMRAYFANHTYNRAEHRNSYWNFPLVDAALLRREDCPEDILNDYAKKYARTPNWGYQSALLGLVKNPACPTDALIRIARCHYSETRAALASRDDLPPAALEILEKDKTAGVLTTLLARGHRSSRFLAHLRTCNITTVVREVIDHGVGDTDFYRAAAKSRRDSIRLAVAENTTDPETLTVLALDRDKSVRKAAITNKACPDEAKVAAVLLTRGT